MLWRLSRLARAGDGVIHNGRLSTKIHSSVRARHSRCRRWCRDERDGGTGAVRRGAGGPAADRGRNDRSGAELAVRADRRDRHRRPGRRALVVCEVKTRRAAGVRSSTRWQRSHPPRRTGCRRLADCWLERHGGPPPGRRADRSGRAWCCPGAARPWSSMRRGWPDGIRAYLLGGAGGRRGRGGRGPGRPGARGGGLHPGRTARQEPGGEPGPGPGGRGQLRRASGRRRSSRSGSARRPCPRAAAASTWPWPARCSARPSASTRGRSPIWC